MTAALRSQAVAYALFLRMTETALQRWWRRYWSGVATVVALLPWPIEAASMSVPGLQSWTGSSGEHSKRKTKRPVACAVCQDERFRYDYTTRGPLPRVGRNT